MPSPFYVVQGIYEGEMFFHEASFSDCDGEKVARDIADGQYRLPVVAVHRFHPDTRDFPDVSAEIIGRALELNPDANVIVAAAGYREAA